MSDTKALASAFKGLTQRPAPPRLLAALTYSERRFFDRAIQDFTRRCPSPLFLRYDQTFHCTKASAVKIHAALGRILHTSQTKTRS